MDKIADEEKVLSINRLRPLLAIWFFAGMPLNMLLSWLYFFWAVLFQAYSFCSPAWFT